MCKGFYTAQCNYVIEREFHDKHLQVRKDLLMLIYFAFGWIFSGVAGVFIACQKAIVIEMRCLLLS